MFVPAVFDTDLLFVMQILATQNTVRDPAKLMTPINDQLMYECVFTLTPRFFKFDCVITSLFLTLAKVWLRLLEMWFKKLVWLCKLVTCSKVGMSMSV